VRIYWLKNTTEIILGNKTNTGRPESAKEIVKSKRGDAYKK